jgi:hypothetical protein
MEQIFVESTKTHREEVSIWKLCSLISFLREEIHTWANSRKDGLDHFGYIIANPTTQFFLFLLTILNQTQFWSMLIS